MSDDMSIPQHRNRDDATLLRAEDICWTLDPVPRAELVDMDELNADEIAAYAADLQRETATLRELLHMALGELSALTVQLNRSKQTVIRLREQQRAA